MRTGSRSSPASPTSILVPDPTTFRLLPWSSGTGWILSDMYFQSGRPVPFCSRQIMKRALATLRERGFDYMAGLEVEFYLTKLEDRKLTPEQSGWPPDAPTVSTVAHGFQYLTEIRNDEIDDILLLLQDNLTEIGLPLRSMEDEWGPGQSEFTFDPQLGLDPADAMLLFRTATKQICRRNGLHATFMTKPALPNFFSSGWHLHQSLVDADGGGNAFTNRADDGAALSELGRYFVGGLIEHAGAALSLRRPDGQRLQALRAGLVRPGPRVLGGGEPRRDDPGDRRARRRELAPGEPRRRALREPVPVHGLPDRRRARRGATASSTRARRTRSRTRPSARCCRPELRRRSGCWKRRATLFRGAFGDPVRRLRAGHQGHELGPLPRPTSPTGSTASTSRSSEP